MVYILIAIIGMKLDAPLLFYILCILGLAIDFGG